MTFFLASRIPAGIASTGFWANIPYRLSDFWRMVMCEHKRTRIAEVESSFQPTSGVAHCQQDLRLFSVFVGVRAF